jgi:hypothetical protein
MKILLVADDSRVADWIRTLRQAGYASRSSRRRTVRRPEKVHSESPTCARTEHA